MVGDNVNVHTGSIYRASLLKLNVPGLDETIREQRIYRPREGVEIASRLFVDSVSLQGSKVVYKYLFTRKKNNVFLLAVKEVGFSGEEIAKIATTVLGLN